MQILQYGNVYLTKSKSMSILLEIKLRFTHVNRS